MAHHLTREARDALVAAQREAVRLRHPEITPEDLLLGLAAAADGPVVSIFSELGISRARLRQTLLDLIDTTVVPGSTAGGVRASAAPLATGGAGAAPTGYDPVARAIIGRSAHEAVRSRQVNVGPQHLLAAIGHEAATIAAQVLSQFGAGLPELRAASAGVRTPLRHRVRWHWRRLRPRISGP